LVLLDQFAEILVGMNYGENADGLLAVLRARARRSVASIVDVRSNGAEKSLTAN